MELNSQATEPADDEFDTLNASIDPEFMPYIVDLPASQETQQISPRNDVSPVLDAPASPKSTYSDEYSQYDLSEFTTEELAAFDDQLTFTKHKAEPQARLPPFGNLSSGPAIEIEIEKQADTPVGGQASAKSVPVVAPPPPPSFAHRTSVSAHGPQRFTQTSAFYRFRRRRNTLAVTDLSSLAWCEVQWEYGLLGKRHRKIENRPASFVSTAGKVIHVDKAAAVSLDKTSKQGTKVHKALEREIHPKKVKVEVTTEEERWALRILQMIDCIQSLVAVGRCREMPVFGILQGQAVVGVIDEIRRAEAPTLPTSRSSSASPSGKSLKRDREASSVPVTPSKPKSKKSRRSPSPSQPTITTFFNHTLNATAGPSNTSHDTRSSTSPKENSTSVFDLHPRFRLHISDTKSRTSASLPPEADMEPAQLQLMMYHRLLSTILASSSDTIFTFLRLARLSTDITFSQEFQAETGLSDVTRLADLVPMLKNAVEMLHVDGVDNQLQIVYRTQVISMRDKLAKDKKGKRKAGLKATSEASATLSKEQKQALIAAVDAAFANMDKPQQPNPGSSAVGEVEGISVVTDLTVLETTQEPTLLADATEVAANTATLAERAKPDVEDGKTSLDGVNGACKVTTELPAETGVPMGRSDSSSDSDSDSDGECADVRQRSLVIGTKEFTVENDRLDAHVASVLKLWYGKREPVGVEAGLTRRCTWCEYHDGCEWREKKAAEARNKPRISPEASSSKV